MRGAGFARTAATGHNSSSAPRRATGPKFIVRWLTPNRYLTRLGLTPTAADRRRVEVNLGALRILLALLGLLSYWLDLGRTHLVGPRVPAVLLLFLAESVAVWLWARHRRISDVFLYALHASDILWPIVISYFAQGPIAPNVQLYSFAILAAAFRWGFPEAVMTALAGSGVLQMEAFILRESPAGLLESNRLLVRCAYLLALGYMAGTLGENEKERRAESAVTVRMLQSARGERSVAAVLETIFRVFREVFVARDAYLVAHEVTSDQYHLWSTRSGGGVLHQYLGEAEGAEAMLSGWPQSFCCKRNRSGGVAMWSPASQSGSRAGAGDLPRLSFLANAPRTLLGLSVPLGQEWRLRLLLPGAQLGRGVQQELGFAHALFEQASTALYGAYLVRKLRTRAGTIERARVARQIHDGVLQSLISAEMRANILRRRSERQWEAGKPDVQALEALLRAEVVELRELMQQMRPLDVHPTQLLDHMAERVDRFRRDSGISARFVTTAADEVPFSAHVCREVLLILQEALVNVRKHAHAAEATVSFGRHDGGWRLSITDDGAGFGFDGTLAGDALMQSARGPAIIKERVASLGGELLIHSTLNRGSQLLILLPQKGSLKDAR
jgi:signal transduction histidine kinase